MEYKQFRDSHYYVWNNGRVSSTKTGKILKGSKKDDRNQIRLTLDGKINVFFLDRLLAEVWLNMKKEQFVVHIDGDRFNDSLDNLKLVNSRQELYKYYRSIGIDRYYNARQVYKFTKDGNRLAEYKSIKEAARVNNMSYDTLRGSLNNKFVLRGKYIYSYSKRLNSKYLKQIGNNIVTRFKYFEDLHLKEGKSFRQIAKETGINKQHFTCLFWIYKWDKIIYKKLKNNGYITLNGKRTSSFLAVYKYLKKEK